MSLPLTTVFRSPAGGKHARVEPTHLLTVMKPLSAKDQLRAGLFLETWAEFDRQDAKWGEQNHPDGTGGESQRIRANGARVICDREHKAGRGTWTHILNEEWAEALAEDDEAKLRAELIQVAAVALQWVAAIDRRRSPKHRAEGPAQ